MKNINHKNNSQINTVCCYIAISLTIFFITACSANHKVSQPTSAGNIEQSGTHTTVSSKDFEQYRDSQLKWLSSLQEGISIEDALKQVLPYMQYSFQYKESGKLFQYFQGQYPRTCMMFGLLFEDGRLTSLLLDKAVWDFDFYRYNYARVKGHFFQYWLPKGLQEGVTTIRQQNRLGDEYNDIMTACRQAVKDNGGTSKAAEAVITTLFFAPLAPAVLMVMPFLPEEEIDGESEEIIKSPDEKLREIASKIELGVTTDKELIQLLGPPAYKSDTSLTYEVLDIKFGILNGIVVWSESWFYE
jgi:hypothetical protein